MTASGGGLVNGAGQPDGSLSYSPVTSLTLPAYSGAVLLLSTNATPSSGGTNGPVVTGLTAFHRSGQTFLTWTEVPVLAGEAYRIYRHTAPVTAATRAAASNLATIAEGSSRPATR